MKENIKMMNHIFIFFIICLLLVSSFPIHVLSSEPNETIIKHKIKNNIVIFEENLVNGSMKQTLSLSDLNMKMQVSENGIRPSYIKTITIPRNAEISSIKYEYHNLHNITLKEPMLSALPQVLNSNNKGKDNLSFMLSSLYGNKTKETIVLDENDLFQYSIGCGISKDEKVLFITMQFYPSFYNVGLNSMNFPSSISYDIVYETPLIPVNVSSSSVELVIICPEEFSKKVAPLVDHKQNMGISTMLKTTDEIYQDYTGRDDAESIKLFIKDALDTWNIKYVLLIGGLKRQTSSWYVPVRYSNLHDRSFWNDTYVTDLYFADVYRYNMQTQHYEFDDWDSNENGVFAEWTWIFDPERGWWYDLDKKDELDLYPDVAIGRLACRNKKEVTAVVDKIIHYETNSFNEGWFKNVVYCGGDTVPYSDGICEGELENAYAASFLEPLGFTSTKLWVSTGSLKGPLDIVSSLRKGAGFFYLSGHGTPREWCTHPISDGDHWVDAYSVEMDLINNNYKLPVCVVGGCHNSQFDVGLYRIPKGILSHGSSYFLWDEGIDCFFKWTWVPSCWSWNLISEKKDGCIAVIGNTGLGWGVGGEMCTEYNEGYLTSHFFQIYATLSQGGYDQLGIVHQESLNDFISHFSANNDLLDRKTVEEWVLLGDPSLKIGGYPSL